MDQGHQPPIERLRQIVERLRSPGGCPWDIEQDHLSLRSALMEECAEVIDAIEASDDPNLREELGDLLLHVVMHSQIARERGAFDLEAVASEICEKLIRRHPHVFGESQAGDVKAVLVQWEEIKRQEKEAGGGESSVMDGVPNSLPSMLKALKAQKKAAKLGLDWDSVEGVLQKLQEEIEELKVAIKSDSSASQEKTGTVPSEQIADEIGDIIFTSINLARMLRVDPEHALRDTTARFINRVRAVERIASGEGVELRSLTLPEIDSYWERAKVEERAKGFTHDFVTSS